MTFVRHRPTLATIDLDAVAGNVERIATAAGVAVCAVVKADGYGHGAVPVARAALEAGASWLAVALVEEAAVLREAGVDAPILLLSEPPVASITAACDLSVTPTAYSARFLAVASRLGQERGSPIGVHVKADTGMARVGIPEHEWSTRLDEITRLDGIEVTGVQTHLACADEPDDEPTSRQLVAFERFRALAAERGLDPRLVHAANTAAALRYPQARYTMVRAGIGIYGLSPSPHVDAADHRLTPAMRLTTAVAYVKRVPAGTAVSYGHRWRAPADGWLATVPIGYADGVPRSAGHGTTLPTVWLAGARRTVAGSVCMDQLMVWCGDDEPRTGDDVVVFGGGHAPRIEDWARDAGTITYEIATGITARVPRVHTGVGS